MMVPGIGPKPSRIAFVGEAPGYHEVKRGVPFVGPSGKEFDRYIRIPRLRRENIYITNLIKEEIPHDSEPARTEIEKWGEILKQELEEVHPEIIVPLGRLSTRWFLGDVNIMDVHGLGVNQFLYLIFPIIHPAAGLHSPDQQSSIVADFENLKRLLAGDTGVYRVKDEWTDPDYEQCDKPLIVSGTIGMDTEGSVEAPWGLSISSACGTSTVVRKGLIIFDPDIQTVLHGALHDYNVLKQMGITPTRFICTQIASFLLGTEPIGLKPLAYRLCGMSMRSYNEVMGEASQRLAREFLEEVNQYEWEEPEAILSFTRDGTPEIRQPRSINWLLDRDFKALDGGKELDLRDRWNKWDTEVKAEVIDTLGEMPVPTLDDIDPDEAIDYSARDADATLRIFNPLMKRIEETHQREVLELDMEVIPMLSRMMEIGMGVDVDCFTDLGEQLQEDLFQLTEDISEIAGYPINPSSDDQLAEFLFNELELKVTRLTKKKKRGSVDKKSLEGLRHDHPVIPLIIEYSEKDTLNSTFAVNLPKFVRDGRIHPMIRLTRVKSGRLETSKPNLLNIPVRTKLGRKLREGFVAGEGRELASWDLDQIEMRVIADLSEDEEMIKVLSNPCRHIHKETCSKLYGMKVSEVDKTSTEYLMSKNVSFGIPYGISPLGLVAQARERGINWDEKDCETFIAEWFKVYPGVMSMIEGFKAQARREGLVRSKLGRIRYLPGIHSTLPYIRSEAERHAVNHPIQTTAQEVLKKAMVDLWDFRTEIQKEGYWEPLLQIHDEVIYEEDEGLFELVDPIVQLCMEGAMDLKVPIRCGGVVGNNWAELK